MPRPAIEKLPLAARKNIRDEWESKKQGYEDKLSSILGEIWNVEVNTLELHAYADGTSAKEEPGRAIALHIESGLPKLEEFVKEHGDFGKEELNTVANTHKIVITVDDTSKINYCGCDIKDGVLRILFKEDQYGSWQSDAFSYLDESLDAASQASSQFSFLPRSSMKRYYDPEIGAVQTKIAELLKVDDLMLNSYAEENATKLAKDSSSSSDWRKEYGTALLKMFKQAATGLEEAKFGEDDMLQEALAEALTSKEIGIKVVDKLNRGSWHEVLVENGGLYLRFQPSYWATDITSRLGDIIDQL